MGYKRFVTNTVTILSQSVATTDSDITGSISSQNTQMLARAKQIKELLETNKGYDQFLLEYKTTRGNRPWIHISYRGDGKNRREYSTFLDDKLAQNGRSNLYNPLV